MAKQNDAKTWQGRVRAGGYNESPSDRAKHESSILQPGANAPTFRLPVTPDQSLSLSELRGAPVVLAFYPADWSPVCGDELAIFNQALPEFKRYGAQILGISVDGAWCHRAYGDSLNLHFPLLADFEPKGAVARSYGAYLPDAGVAARALFVTDGDGMIHWSYLSPLAVSPGADGVLAALERMQAAGLVGSGSAPAW